VIETISPPVKTQGKAPLNANQQAVLAFFKASRDPSLTCFICHTRIKCYTLATIRGLGKRIQPLRQSSFQTFAVDAPAVVKYLESRVRREVVR